MTPGGNERRTYRDDLLSDAMRFSARNTSFSLTFSVVRSNTMASMSCSGFRRP